MFGVSLAEVGKVVLAGRLAACTVADSSSSRLLPDGRQFGRNQRQLLPLVYDVGAHKTIRDDPRPPLRAPHVPQKPGVRARGGTIPGSWYGRKCSDLQLD